MKRITDMEIGNIEWTEEPSGNYKADFSFIDDYPKEVERLLDAQFEADRKSVEDARGKIAQLLSSWRADIARDSIITDSTFKMTDQIIAKMLEEVRK